MTQTWYDRQTCRLCNSPVELLVKLKPTPLANAYVPAPAVQALYPLSLKKCVSCDHVQLGVVVNPKVLYADYRYKTGVSESFKKHLRLLADEFSTPGFVVEIGSNDGTLLDFYAERGHHVIGVDPAATGSNHVVVKKPFNSNIARNFMRKANLVVAINVLAHIDNLRDVIRGVHHLLEDDGTFVFEVQYLGDLVKQNHWDMIYHEHLDYHHIAPLNNFLASEGLFIQKVKHVATQGGSIRVYAGKRDMGYKPPVEKIDIEGFVNKLKNLRNPLIGVTGKIAGYGAPAKATTFMYQTGARVDFIVDDTKEKQGMYTPGLNIPIVSPHELLTRKHDGVFPLAWNFAAELKAKHPELNWISP